MRESGKTRFIDFIDRLTYREGPHDSWRPILNMNIESCCDLIVSCRRNILNSIG